MRKRDIPNIGIGELLGQMGGDPHAGCEGCQEIDSMTPEQHRRLLTGMRGSFEAKTDLKIGDVVTWKERLNNLQYPGEGHPAVVVRVLDEPMCMGGQMVRGLDGTIVVESYDPPERLDVVLGLLIHGKYVELYFDSRRFRLWDKGDDVARERNARPDA